MVTPSSSEASQLHIRVLAGLTQDFAGADIEFPAVLTVGGLGDTRSLVVVEHLKEELDGGHPTEYGCRLV
ncbi:MAG: hypothetical protein QGI86_03210 [Candidatus Poribacteria bacterium]|nr:hypothetical protein [Candidatus Poribacteria bacterium]MDP6745550.1 hypothetical protein [Candidatus Poribacteria bacterium]MDP6995499.1 hypothetical protein [Candidatus Poribacteria bacterium]